jgi:hypothetical protein
MPKDYDPTLKAMVEGAPDSWLPAVGRPLAPVTVEDADLATLVSGAVDKVLRVHADPPYLVHLDFQAGHDSARLPPRLRLYNAVLDYRHDLPVLSVAVLLHPDADSPQLTGRVERAVSGEPPHAFLGYKVLRVWEMSVEQLLTGGLGPLPLAPISNVGQEDLPEVICSSGCARRPVLGSRTSGRQPMFCWACVTRTSLFEGYFKESLG